MKRLLYIILFLIFALPAFSADHYFDATDGNDSTGAGTSGDPWQTIAKAETECTSGDTCYFASEETWTSASTRVLSTATGVTYDGSTYGSGTRATFQATANLNEIITIMVSNVTVQGFDCDMNDQEAIGIRAYAYNSNISNITIDDCLAHDTIGGFTYGINVLAGVGHTISNVTVNDCTVYNINRDGIAIYAGGTGIEDTVTVSGCTVYNAGLDSGSGIVAKNDTRNVTIEDCITYGNARSGIDIIGDSTIYPVNTIIRRNKSYDNDDHGLAIRESGTGNYPMTADVYNNFIYSNGANEISISGDLLGGTIDVYNNTLVADALAAMNVNSVGTAPTLNFKNNIAYSTANYQVVYDGSDILTHSNNLIFRTTGAGDTHVEASSSYDRAGVTTWEATAQNTDPLFVSIGTNDYRVQSGSDAIDNGADLSAYFTDDYYGTTRPYNSVYDIGAYEYEPAAEPSITGATEIKGATIK